MGIQVTRFVNSRAAIYHTGILGEVVGSLPLTLFPKLKPIGGPSLVLLRHLSQNSYTDSTIWQIMADPDKSSVFAGLVMPRPLMNDQLCNSIGRLSETGYLLNNELVQKQYYLQLATEPESATTPEQILFNNFIDWPTYSILWDSVYPEENRDAQSRKFGTIKNPIIDTLTMLGLARRWDAPRRGHAGRPYKTVMPNAWGVRLVKLLDGLGYTVPDEARKYARAATGRRTGYEARQAEYDAELARLGITRTTNSTPPVGIVPTAVPDFNSSLSIDTERPKSDNLVPQQPNRDNLAPQQTKPVLGPPPPGWTPPEPTPFVIDHTDLPPDWDKEV